MTEQTAAQELMDHAGAFYGWFHTITVEGDTLKVEAASDYVGDDDSLTGLKYLTETDLRTAAQALTSTFEAGTYEGDFLVDFLARNYEQADGDMNIVDAILQQAMWGTLVFG